jgi:hypothetical protein
LRSSAVAAARQSQSDRATEPRLGLRDPDHRSINSTGENGCGGGVGASTYIASAKRSNDLGKMMR